MDFEQALAAYDYEVPKKLIAQKPATPRDSARLLVHDRKTKSTTITRFSRIGDFLPEHALLVLNETKVIPARLPVRRGDGTTVHLLLLGHEHGVIAALAPKKLKTGEVLSINKRHTLVVMERNAMHWLLKPQFPIGKLKALLRRHGIPPLPPYIDRSPLTKSQLKKRYQTVFARNEGSIAAPTASLHFTNRLLASLQKRGINVARVTLHVHLGTFAKLTEEQWKSGELHREEYVIDARAKGQLEHAKRTGRPIVAVGTTVVRTLESAFDAHGKIVRPRGETDLFIREGYAFKAIDHLITNFHVPRSSLLMLVSAFAGRRKVLDLYERAKHGRMRFFSFGDAMLIL